MRYDYYLTRNLMLVRTERGTKPEPPPAMRRMGVFLSPEDQARIEAAETIVEKQVIILDLLKAEETQYEIVHGPFRTKKAALAFAESNKS
jgi:hypothetical protein